MKGTFRPTIVLASRSARRIALLSERLGPHPARSLGLDLNEPADVARWFTTACLLAGRGAEARATMRGQLAGLLGLPNALRKRSTIQAQRRADDSYLESLLV